VELDLKGNGLNRLPCVACSGGLPSALATHPHLVELDLKGNGLNRLPREWARGWAGAATSSLVIVRFSVNNFTGPFPAGLARAPHLRDLLMGTNAFRWGALRTCILSSASVGGSV
jgi:hypothetical protein